jgi:hypothetical protein
VFPAATERMYRCDRISEKTALRKDAFEQVRTILYNLNVNFAKIMQKHGHRRVIKNLGPAGLFQDDKDDINELSGDQVLLTRDEILQNLKQDLFCNDEYCFQCPRSPIEDLFRDQASLWTDMATHHVMEVWIKLKQFFEGLVGTPHWFPHFRQPDETLDCTRIGSQA